ncbi:MFS transporter [Lutibacter sp.]|uniref:MDR family MFS transporter n=1 Tax=Lutibacter sp. TaxID=1925666 RepID=UPI00273612C3|nr:MFS transporter [Lutibacter sp.]MDP3314426.1 MFS transporter [Lutibacter sp.]
MLKRIITSYHESFRGLSKEVWWLALITFINRAGTMVLSFLSLYLVEDLELSYAQVGWIMSCFGLGSLLGSWLGGKLTDKIGYYKVMFWSLFITGFLFIGLQFIHSFYGFALAIFFIMAIADSFRPAMYVALKAYSKPENRTRSLTLVRLAINLGFSFGPFLGGIIITFIGYSGLFWVDGITCILAIILMRNVLKNKDLLIDKTEIIDDDEFAIISVYKDKPYWIFLVVVFLMGFVFFQLFTTMPLFYKEVHGLTEVEIGLIMALNGFIIFLFEMPLIHFLEKKFLDKLKLITYGLILFGISFLILNSSSWAGILIISVLIITLAEMLAFPFTNNFAINRAPEGKEGKYLALYAMAFSCAHIFSAKTGMEVIARFGYTTNWLFMAGLALVAVILMVWLKNTLILERKVQ